jgi:hypothetical protein
MPPPAVDLDLDLGGDARFLGRADRVVDSGH